MPRKAWTQEDVTRGLISMVSFAGNAAEASRALERAGHRIPQATLLSWKTKHVEDYNRIRSEHQHKLEDVMVFEQREIIMRALDVTNQLLNAAEKRVKSGEERDPARAAANVSAVMEKNLNKLLGLTGRPEKITEARKPEEIMKSLEKMGVLRVIEGGKE